MLVRRVFVVVLDGVGMGELPDAAGYGDAGSSTLANLATAVGGIRLPTLERLGLGRVLPIAGVAPVREPAGCWGRLVERSPGKDSVTGHWEMMGIILDRPFPTYPGGFPATVVAEFEKIVGRRVLANRPASGTEIIAELGAEHVATGNPILYTSADSVFQVAAHEDVVPLPKLYEWCEQAREMLCGDHHVGRVIARPFAGAAGSYVRTAGRKDYAAQPPRNVIDALTEAGDCVMGIGKTPEFFDGRGFDEVRATRNNADHCAALLDAAACAKRGLVFANLEDFDMLYGHRNDVRGFAEALEWFDRALEGIVMSLAEGDLLILTSDHGNDPTTLSTDHSREYALLLTYAPGSGSGADLGVRATFADIGATVADALGVQSHLPGVSFLQSVVRQ